MGIVMQGAGLPAGLLAGPLAHAAAVPQAPQEPQAWTVSAPAATAAYVGAPQGPPPSSFAPHAATSQPPAAHSYGALAAPAATGAAAGTVPVSVNHGGDEVSGALVQRALDALRQGEAGRGIVDRMLAVGATVNVASDADFAVAGQADSHAFYDPNSDSIWLRRSQLENDVGMAALALAHEGVHMLDDKGDVSARFTAQKSAELAQIRDPAALRGAMATAQLQLELAMEARAFTYAGQVASELGLRLAEADPTTVAMRGGNDFATYEAVWAALLGSSYNSDRASVPVTYL